MKDDGIQKAYSLICLASKYKKAKHLVSLSLINNLNIVIVYCTTLEYLSINFPKQGLWTNAGRISFAPYTLAQGLSTTPVL